jgi:hypothetical protein
LDICLNKENGGLEVRWLHEFNLDLLDKIVLEERKSLWYRVLTTRCGEEGGAYVMVEVQTIDLVHNIRREVDDGYTTLVWKDSRVEGVPFSVRFSRLF